MSGLMVAAYHGHANIIEALLCNGADVNFRNKEGSTALIFAAYHKNSECAKILIMNKADVDIKDAKGVTALYWAKKFKMDDVIEMINNVSSGHQTSK